MHRTTRKLRTVMQHMLAINTKDRSVSGTGPMVKPTVTNDLCSYLSQYWTISDTKMGSVHPCFLNPTVKCALLQQRYNFKNVIKGIQQIPILPLNIMNKSSSDLFVFLSVGDWWCRPTCNHTTVLTSLYLSSRNSCVTIFPLWIALETVWQRLKTFLQWNWRLALVAFRNVR